MRKCLACYEQLEMENSQEYHKNCSKKIFGKLKAPILEYDLTEINDLAKEVISRRLAIPGVQPKLSLSIDTTSLKATDSRFTIVGLWDGIFVLKPPTKDFPCLPEIEDVSMHMAESCGIKTAKHSLTKFNSGEIAYLAKRFDRVIKGRKVIKLHQEDMCQLTGLLTENKYNSSMEKVAKATRTFTTHKGLEMVALFQITIYSFLIGNSDMHLKNFSILQAEDKTIGLSPAYDLLSTSIVVPEDKEELALSISGKKSKLNIDDFYNFAQFCEISKKVADNIFDGFEKNLGNMKNWIQKSFLDQEKKQEFLSLIEARSKRLSLKIPDNFQEIR